MRRHAQSSPGLLEKEATCGNPAMHGGNCAAGGVAKPINEWELFHACGVKTATGRLRKLVATTCLLCVIFGVSHMCRNGFSMEYMAVDLVGSALLILCAEVTYKLTHALDASQSILVGCTGQLFIFWGLNYFVMCLSLASPNELMRHRVWLTMSLPLLVAGPYIFRMPQTVFALAYCPSWISAWVYFHYLVGFLKPVCVAFGIVACLTISYLQHVTIQDCWEYFQITRALEEERKLLMATQKALHGMLSVLWDASCNCNAHGVISSSTPHLEQLLGAADDLVGSSLCAFAANQADVERLQEFLRNTASAADHQALSLQCALRPQGADRHEKTDACGSKVYDVALYGIKLPPSATFQAGRSIEPSDNLFVGIKASAPEATIGEPSCSAFTDDFITADHVAMDSSMSAIGATGNACQQTTNQQGFEQGSEVAFTLSSCSVTTRLPVLSFQRDASTQTSEAPSPATSCPSSASSPRLNSSTQLAAASSRPPCLPMSGDAPTSISAAMGKAPRGKQSLRKSRARSATGRVALCSSKLALPGFEETPRQSMQFLVCNALVHMNSRGSGCCSFHVALARLSLTVCEMRDGAASFPKKPCMPDFKPNDDWQCAICKCMNEFTEGDENDDQLNADQLQSCAVCLDEGHAVPRQDPSGEDEHETSRASLGSAGSTTDYQSNS